MIKSLILLLLLVGSAPVDPQKIEPIFDEDKHWVGLNLDYTWYNEYVTVSVNQKNECRFTVPESDNEGNVLPILKRFKGTIIKTPDGLVFNVTEVNMLDLSTKNTKSTITNFNLQFIIEGFTLKLRIKDSDKINLDFVEIYPDDWYTGDPL